MSDLLKLNNGRDEWRKESEGEKMKPDGVSDDIFNDLVNALDKAIMLIYDMSIRKVAIPGDMIYRWYNLIKYARAKEIAEGAKPTCKTTGMPCCRCQPVCEHRG